MDKAVIKTGGKQYLVSKGSKIKVEKLSEEEGKKVTFKEVLLVASGKTVKFGAPGVKNAKIEGKILKHGRHKKITGVKMKAKKRNRKLFGHKQHYTEVEITNIKTT